MSSQHTASGALINATSAPAAFTVDGKLHTAFLHNRNGKPDGIEMIVPDWFYAAVLDDALVLTIDRNYFRLTGGLARWLYRLVRKHGGKQEFGWSFDFPHLHAKSGSLSPLKHFAYDLRDIVRRQALPGYRLTIEQPTSGPERLSFVPTDPTPLGMPRRRRSNTRSGDKL